MTPPGKPNLRAARVGRANSLSAVPRVAASIALPRPNRRLSSLFQFGALVFADVFALMASGFIAYGVWGFGELAQPFAMYARLLPLLALFPCIYAVFGLYPGFGLGAPEIIRRLVSATSLSFVLLAGATFIVKLPHEYSRVTFAIAWILSLAMLPLSRFIVLTVVRKFPWWGEPTVVIGNPAQIELTMDLLRDAKSLGYRVVGVLCSDVSFHGGEIGGVSVLGGHELAPALASGGVGTAIVWGGSRGGYGGRNGTLDRANRMGWLQLQFRHVVILRGDDGLPVEHVQVRNLGTVLGIEFSNELLRPENRFVKRVLDIVLGAAFLVISVPIIFVSGLIITIVSPGPMFFRQEREGLDGRKINIWKLRTMHADAERRLSEHLGANPALRSEWEAKLKLTRDPRVVRGIGAFLRRFSIDELPQLFCVLGGTMSLVGPRPLPDYHLEIFPREFRELRRTVRPGLTGMWQVTVRSSGGLEEHQRYDSYYVRNWSMWLDFYVMARTAFAVLAARGAF
ncbi:MAG TPA: exopolysaccharide biosynthesis polyprenyl glycosylphosphotransferase [Candidatus Binataceae bacterium]|nr:exopolysaccharide biosynthesis polyprenyl glycosylphosphotransferase [Candidatus Binataceae bacterium]